MVVILQLVIGLEGMRPHGHVARTHMGWQRHVDRRDLLAVFAAALQRQAHGIWMWHIAIERRHDGRLQLGSPVAPQQTHQGGRNGAEIGTPLSGPNQQFLAGWSRVGEMIGGALAVCFALLIDESPDMGGILDPLALVVTARMAGQYLLSIDDADPVGISQHGQRSPHVAVWHRVIVLVEADVTRSAVSCTSARKSALRRIASDCSRR